MALDEVREVLDERGVLLERAHGRVGDEELDAAAVGLEGARDERVHADDEGEGLERAGALGHHPRDLGEDILHGAEDGLLRERAREGEELGEGEGRRGLPRALLDEPGELCGGEGGAAGGVGVGMGAPATGRRGAVCMGMSRSSQGS